MSGYSISLVGVKMTNYVPGAILQQSRPDPVAVSLPEAVGTYEQAVKRFVASAPTAEVDGSSLLVSEVTPEQVAASIMRFLEGVADDEGGNAARYFPAILVSRMARRIAEDLNSILPEIAP